MDAANPRAPTRRPVVLILIAAVIVLGVTALTVWLLRSGTTTASFEQPPIPVAVPTLAAPEPAFSPQVYVADLSSRVRPPEFSTGSVTLTRKGEHLMLGRFDSSGVTFTLERLPPHEYVHLEFDLVILNSWNGSSTYWGPDAWLCQEVDGRPLFNATFCNCGFFDNNNAQTFPDQFPAPVDAAPHPAWTGAKQHESLGEMMKFTNGSNGPFTADVSSVYHMNWTFLHQKPTLQLQFTEETKQKKMRWAFMSFRAEAVPHAAKMSASDLAAAWNDLGDEDAVKASAAVWRFALGGDDAVQFIRTKLAQPADGPAVSPYRVGRVDHIMQLIATPGAEDLITGVHGGL